MASAPPKKASSKTNSSSKSLPKRASKKRSVSKKQSVRQRLRTNIQDLRSRRPHRSFRLTKRREYHRSLKLPGYFAFTAYVWRTIVAHKKTFLLLALLYTGLGIVFGTITSQDTYNQMSGIVQGLSNDVFGGDINALLQAGTIAITTFAGANSLTDVQKLYVGLMFLLTWLTTVWLLREYLVNRAPKLRDGVYNAGAPIISTMLVMLWFLVQLLPIALLSILFSALVNAGLLINGFGAFVFSMIAVLLISLSLYWLTSTFIAAVVVTLPGMYPMQAIKAASDLVLGRRLRILYRILWLALSIILSWIVVMIPVIMLDTWLQHYFEWLAAIPWVPVVAALLAALTTIWASGYIYLLYRKVVEDDASPA